MKSAFNRMAKYLSQSGGHFLLYLLVIYTFVMLGRSVLINYQLQKQIHEIEFSIEEIKTKNQDLKNLILYYQSDSFREVEARRKLGLKKPDEKVFTVSVQKFTDFNTEIEAQKESLESKNDEEKVSNLSLWWRYLKE